MLGWPAGEEQQNHRLVSHERRPLQSMRGYDRPPRQRQSAQSKRTNSQELAPAQTAAIPIWSGIHHRQHLNGLRLFGGYFRRHVLATRS